MNWLRDAAWQQGIAILLVVAGAVVIHRSAGGGGGVLAGFILFATGIALPLVSQALHARRDNATRSDDV